MAKVSKPMKVSMKATKKVPAMNSQETMPDESKGLYHAVLHCTKPKCPSWIFMRKFHGGHCVVCHTPWSQSYPKGAMGWSDVTKTTKKKATKPLPNDQKPKKAMKAMKAHKTMKAK